MLQVLEEAYPFPKPVTHLGALTFSRTSLLIATLDTLRKWMKTAASKLKVPTQKSVDETCVRFREQPIEMPVKMGVQNPGNIHRAWSMEALPPPGMVVTRPLKKGGVFGGNSIMQGSWQVLATQTLKIASINGLGHLNRLENDLEDEISYENRSPAKTAVGRLRREGHAQLHSKVVLFVVVVLNIIDTVLVMVGLILDFHHVSQLLEAKIGMMSSFAENLSRKYGSAKSNNEILQVLLDAHIIFNASEATKSVAEQASDCAQFLNTTAASLNQSTQSYMDSLPRQNHSTADPNYCFRSYVDGNETYQLTNTGEVDETLSTVAHKLHYSSLAILSVLIIILMLKLFCSGHRFFKDHMQVFDGLITIISFVLDIVYINGVTIFNQEQFVVILSLLFPWRVIRILNSLIAAVLDQHKLNLKILYTQKKKIQRTLAETTTKMEVLQRHVESLQNLCTTRGIGEYEISRALGGENYLNTQKNGATGGLASMMALGKLAFQAADAFAPITNDFSKDKNEDASPTTSSTVDSEASSPNRSSNTDTTMISQNNISNSKTQIFTLEKNGGLANSESYSNALPRASIDEVVTLHANGSGPPRERHTQRRRKDNKVSASLPDLTEDDRSTDTDFVSRL